MNSSKSSTASISVSGSESYIGQDTSYETDTETTKQSQFLQARPNRRFIMADEHLPHQTPMSHYPGVATNMALAHSHSQFLMEKNYMNQALCYNQQMQAGHGLGNFIPPAQNYQRYPQPYRQNIEFSVFAAQQQQTRPEMYIPRQPGLNPQAQRRQQNFSSIYGTSSRVQETHMGQKPGPLAGYLPNSRNRFFLVDSYGSRYNLNYPPNANMIQPGPFYSNNAFNDNLEKLPPQQDQMSRPQTPSKNNGSELDTQSVVAGSQQGEEIMPPVASNWSMAGGFANSFNSQKYYRDPDAADENPFYTNEFGKEKHNYLTLDGTSVKPLGDPKKKCKIGCLVALIGCLILAGITGIVLGTVFPTVIFGNASLLGDGNMTLVELVNGSNDSSSLQSTLRGINALDNNTIELTSPPLPDNSSQEFEGILTSSKTPDDASHSLTTFITTPNITLINKEDTSLTPENTTEKNIRLGSSQQQSEESYASDTIEIVTIKSNTTTTQSNSTTDLTEDIVTTTEAAFLSSVKFESVNIESPSVETTTEAAETTIIGESIDAPITDLTTKKVTKLGAVATEATTDITTTDIYSLETNKIDTSNIDVTSTTDITTAYTTIGAIATEATTTDITTTDIYSLETNKIDASNKDVTSTTDKKTTYTTSTESTTIGAIATEATTAGITSTETNSLGTNKFDASNIDVTNTTVKTTTDTTSTEASTTDLTTTTTTTIESTTTFETTTPEAIVTEATTPDAVTTEVTTTKAAITVEASITGETTTVADSTKFISPTVVTNSSEITTTEGTISEAIRTVNRPNEVTSVST